VPTLEGPKREEYWSPVIETLSRDKLKKIQSEKLEVVVRLLCDHSSLLARKIQGSGYKAEGYKVRRRSGGDTMIEKKDIAQDIERNPRLGSFCGVTDGYWLKNGWVPLMTTGTTEKRLIFRRTEFDRI
jgi:phenylacetate-coenzyme A ligase PaaK-like adenylate-forming protein